MKTIAFTTSSREVCEKGSHEKGTQEAHDWNLKSHARLPILRVSYG